MCEYVLLSLCIIQEPGLSQTPTLSPYSTNMMNIRDDGYLWACYAIRWGGTYPLFSQSLITDIRSSGTMVTRSPLLLLISRVSGWTLNINELKPNSHIFEIHVRFLPINQLFFLWISQKPLKTRLGICLISFVAHFVNRFKISHEHIIQKILNDYGMYISFLWHYLTLYSNKPLSWK